MSSITYSQIWPPSSEALQNEPALWPPPPQYHSISNWPCMLPSIHTNMGDRPRMCVSVPSSIIFFASFSFFNSPQYSVTNVSAYVSCIANKPSPLPGDGPTRSWSNPAVRPLPRYRSWIFAFSPKPLVSYNPDAGTILERGQPPSDADDSHFDKCPLSKWSSRSREYRYSSLNRTFLDCE